MINFVGQQWLGFGRVPLLLYEMVVHEETLKTGRPFRRLPKWREVI